MLSKDVGVERRWYINSREDSILCRINKYFKKSKQSNCHLCQTRCAITRARLTSKYAAHSLLDAKLNLNRNVSDGVECENECMERV